MLKKKQKNCLDSRKNMNNTILASLHNEFENIINIYFINLNNTVRNERRVDRRI